MTSLQTEGMFSTVSSFSHPNHDQDEVKNVKYDGPSWMQGLNELETLWIANTNDKNKHEGKKQTSSSSSNADVTNRSSDSITSRINNDKQGGSTKSSTGAAGDNRDAVRTWLMEVTDNNGQALTFEN